MDRHLNPFTPGAGKPPKYLIGRERDIQYADQLCRRAFEDLQTDKPAMIKGLRGVGKTALLLEFEKLFSAQNWLTARTEAARTEAAKQTDTAEQFGVVAAEIKRAARGNKSLATRFGRGVSKVVEAFKTIDSLSISTSVGPVRVGARSSFARASSEDLQINFQETVEDIMNALDSKIGFVLMIDEAQNLAKTPLAALLRTQHWATQKNLPFYVILCGLPGIQGNMSTAVSYSERMFHSLDLSRLTSDQSVEALTLPLRDKKVELEPEAIQLLTDASGRYPYFIQEYGAAAWDCAPESPITAAIAKEAIKVATTEIDKTFFQQRWETATPSERKMMEAMSADHDEPASISEVGNRMGTTPQNVQQLRARLIGKGLIYAPEHGQVAFTAPNMASFIKRRVIGGYAENRG